MSKASRNAGPLRALLELTLIVVGVLIALAAESWWQTRGDRARADEYVEALQADMALAISRVHDVIAGTEAQLETTDRYLAGVRGAEGGASEIGGDSHALGGFLTFPTGTLEALVETGDINLLDPEVRRSIVDTHALIQRLQELSDDMGRSALENLNRAQVAKESLGLNIGRMEAVSSLAASESPELVASLETHKFILDQRILIFRLMNQGLEDLAQALEEAD